MARQASGLRWRIAATSLFLGCLLISIVSGSASGQGETIKMGGYTFGVQHESLPPLRKPVSGSNVRCGLTANIQAQVSDDFTTSITESVLRELSTALGIDFSVGTPAAKLSAAAELRNKIMSEAKTLVQRGVIITATQTLPSREYRCYNQWAVIVYKGSKYSVRPSKPGRVYGTTALADFDWTVNTDFELQREIKYDESCDRSRCMISSKTEAVRGEGGQELWVHVL